jgi:hypothetical protein
MVQACISSNGGLINLTANSIALVAKVNATSAGNVSIQTVGAGVNLGGADDSANLGLTQTELNQITANRLTIGDPNTGNISLSQNVNWTSTVRLSSSSPVSGTFSNSDQTFTQGSNSLTVSAGTIKLFNPLVVSSSADSGDGSLRDAVAYANSRVGDDEITFGSSLSGSTITLTTPITINDATGLVKISGPASGSLTIGTSNSTGVFVVQTAATLSNMTFTSVLTSSGNLSLVNVTSSSSTAVNQTGRSLSLTNSCITNTISIAGGANYTVSGGTLGSTVSTTRANLVSITNYNGNLTLGTINANGVTVAANVTRSCITVSGVIRVSGAGSVSLTSRNAVINSCIISRP